MNPRILAPLFMLSSTFSLSLTGLLSKFLAHEIPLQSLSFLRF
ncbi:MAG: EamA family transporter, partial [Vibrio sp.]|nr:EamA family transporter [Vibrio sp.]